MKKSYFQDWLFYVAGWTIITLAFTYAALINIRIFLNMFAFHELIADNLLAEYLISDYQFLEAVLFGIAFGSFFFAINMVIDTTHIHRLPFGMVLLLKSLMYSIAVFIAFFVIYYILRSAGLYNIPDLDENVRYVMDVPEFLFFIAGFFVFGTVLMNFLSQINKKFGPGNLLFMFLGRYHHPRIEDRIFLFIDLKDSTTIAEKLGHIRYSRLLQSFFNDLNYVLPKYHGDIYQYVGDEAVVTWKKQAGLKDLNCIRFHYAFRKRIDRRSGYYQKKYSLVPDFKAGLNMGEVTAAEVGILKREIAYHGDVLNTAARIQQLCNEYGKSILTTQSVVVYLPKRDFNIQLLGEKILKGKVKPEKIYSID
jgi:adenylate cyclase